jgi:hypothetical protein
MRCCGSDGIELDEPYYGRRWLYAQGNPELLFTENETNAPLLWAYGEPGYFKDGIGEFVVHGNRAAVNPAGHGTKGAAHYQLTFDPGKSPRSNCGWPTMRSKIPSAASSNRR